MLLGEPGHAPSQEGPEPGAGEGAVLVARYAGGAEIAEGHGRAADVVEEGGNDDFGAVAGAAGQVGALEGVLELANGLAIVGKVFGGPQGSQDLLVGFRG